MQLGQACDRSQEHFSDHSLYGACETLVPFQM